MYISTKCNRLVFVMKDFMDLYYPQNHKIKSTTIFYVYGRHKHTHNMYVHTQMHTHKHKHASTQKKTHIILYKCIVPVDKPV